MDELTSTRLDKWLWAARCFKTRSRATEACTSGDVRVNGDIAKPARAVRVGDLVRAKTEGGERVMKVLVISEDRGPATTAQLLYEDQSPPPPPREPRAAWLFAAPEEREPGAGRPTKRDRRAIDRLKDL